MEEFIAAASAFRHACENAVELGREGLLDDLSRTLPRLQAAAMELPDVEVNGDHPVFSLEDREGESSPCGVLDLIRQTDWAHVQSSLHEHIGDCKSLAATPDFIWDDLDDIYRDIKEGFDILDAGFSEAEAVWHWRFHFWSHWGYHIAEVQRVIHYYAALYFH